MFLVLVEFLPFFATALVSLIDLGCFTDLVDLRDAIEVTLALPILLDLLLDFGFCFNGSGLDSGVEFKLIWETSSSYFLKLMILY
jgi:hypothetical protein